MILFYFLAPRVGWDLIIFLFPLARDYDSELAIIDTLFPFHGPSGPFLLYLEARTGH
jgi:hypothetical protein